jgi:hypothetical protein
MKQDQSLSNSTLSESFSHDAQKPITLSGTSTKQSTRSLTHIAFPFFIQSFIE